MTFNVLQQRVDHTICARCRKRFAAGDRVQPAMIVKNPDARDPATKLRAAEMSDEFELVHADCRNPSLDGRLVVG